MSEKTVNVNENPVKKERFEFVFSVNDNIICQRYFRIYNFNRKSYSSLDLVYSIDKCVKMINNGLKTKMQIYYNVSAPQVFVNKAEMANWLANPNHKLDVPSYVVFEEDKTVHVWNGVEIEDYPKENYFRVNDYLKSDNDAPCVFKFAFLDNGHEVCSKIWDGSVFPPFVRSNIDLSSTKNRYKNADTYDIFYGNIIDMCNESIEECISPIMKEISKVCSMENVDYTSSIKFGNKTYSLDINKINEKYEKSLEKYYRKKTEEYFKY